MRRVRQDNGQGAKEEIMQVTLNITEKQLCILKELVADEIDNDCPNTRDDCNDLYSKLCCISNATENLKKKKGAKDVR